MSPVSNARILIADALDERGVAILKESGLQADIKTGLSEDELLKIIGAYDGMIVRSSTTVTKKLIEAGKKLQLIGRAGVGVDNIDQDAATQAGIVVENTPLGNITSAAEHAVALLFAVARNVAQADAQMRGGTWDKKSNTGVELTGKTLGVVGMGKVGGIVTRVGRSLDMKVLVYDPYLTDRKAEDLGVQRRELAEVLSEADFLTLHTPLTPETKNLINKARLSTMKKTARLVNAARGGIVNEADLAEALKSGTIAAAALDVFDQEPLAADSPLRGLKNIVLTPHLGASTEEAQTRVAEDIARQFVEFFRDGVIKCAVNISLTLDPKIAGFAKLAEILGATCGQIVQNTVDTFKLGCYGQMAKNDTRPLSLFALKGLLSKTSSDPVTLVNAPVIAEARGLELIEHKSEKASGFSNLLVAGVVTSEGEHTVSGTCFDNQEMRITGIDDLEIDLKPARHLLLMFYPDRPGMVGKFGTILGEADINIANMTVGRREKRGQAVVALTLDDPAPPDVLARLKQAARIEELYEINLNL